MRPLRGWRPATHTLWWVAGLGVVAALVAVSAIYFGGSSGATSETDGAASPHLPPESWANRTAELLEQIIWIDDQSAMVLWPAAMSEADPVAQAYDTAITLRALGSHAPAAVEEVGFEPLQQRLEQHLVSASGRFVAADTLSLHVAREALHADGQVPGLLTETLLEMFARVIDMTISVRPEGWHASDIQAAVEVSIALDHRTEETFIWAEEMGPGLDLSCDEEGLFAVRSAAIAGVPLPCDDETLGELWDVTVQTLHSSPDDRGQSCQLLLAVAELWHATWRDVEGRRAALVELLEDGEARLAASPIDRELRRCLRSVQAAGLLVEREAVLTGAMVEYLRVFLVGGGEPAIAEVIVSVSDEYARTARLVGASREIPPEIAEEASPYTRLSWDLEQGGPGTRWSSEFASTVDEVATRDTQDPRAVAVLMRALTYGGRAACDSLAVSVAEEIVDGGIGLEPDVLGLAAQAQAVRALETCGLAEPEAGGDIVDAAVEVLRGLQSDGPPELEEAADAAAALCALSPDLLPDKETRWAEYSSEASAVGGTVMSGDRMSLRRSEALATIVLAEAKTCQRYGAVA